MRKTLVTNLVQAVLTTGGATTTELRRAVSDRVRRRALETTEESASSGRDSDLLSEEMKAHVDLVAEHAHDVTTEQVRTLLDAGLSEDAIFELTVVAAVARGTLQLERGLEALEAGR